MQNPLVQKSVIALHPILERTRFLHLKLIQNIIILKIMGVSK
jgi:hypothetical protein